MCSWSLVLHWDLQPLTCRTRSGMLGSLGKRYRLLYSGGAALSLPYSKWVLTCVCWDWCKGAPGGTGEDEPAHQAGII